MRKLLRLLSLCTLLLSTVFCTKEQSQEDIILNEKRISVISRKTSIKTSFTAKTDWKLYSEHSWIVITSETQGTAGKHYISMDIEKQPSSTYYREGYVYIETAEKRYHITIAQGNKSNSGGSGTPGTNM